MFMYSFTPRKQLDLGIMDSMLLWVFCLFYLLMAVKIRLCSGLFKSKSKNTNTEPGML